MRTTGPTPAAEHDDDATCLLVDWMPVPDWIALHPGCGLSVNTSPRGRLARRLYPPLPLLAVSLRPDLPAETAAEVILQRETLAEALLPCTPSCFAQSYEVSIPMDDTTGDPHVLISLNAIHLTAEDEVEYLLAPPVSFRLDLARHAAAIAAVAAVDYLVVADADDPDGAVFSLQRLNPGGLGRSVAFAAAFADRSAVRRSA